MDEILAQQTITAHAACSIEDGCNLCPFYDVEKQRTKQRGLCQEGITADKVREALTVLRGNIE